MTEWHIFTPVMFPLFYQLPRTIGRIFWGRNLWWHALAIGLTLLLVTTGTDGWYFRHFDHSALSAFLFPAVWIGFLIPVMLPVLLLILGYIIGDFLIRNIAWALGQAAFLGWLVSSFYKAFTGRPGPHEWHHLSGLSGASGLPGADPSRVFRIGFWRGGIFWGWPSSHTAVACAMAFTLFYLFPRNKWVRYLAPLYGLYIGVGVSMSIHWFSDFIAGTIFGYVIGSVAGRAFGERAKEAAA